MMSDGKIIAAASSDLNQGVFISHDVEWSAKSGAGSCACLDCAVKRQVELAAGRLSIRSGF
jgi:hypothetical protein